MPDSTNAYHNTIVALERFRRALLKCPTKTELIQQIDLCIEEVYGVMQKRRILDLPSQPDLLSKIHYLKEYRAIAYELMQEQLTEYSRDVALVITTIQFELWEGRNPELFKLVDSVDSDEL